MDTNLSINAALFDKALLIGGFNTKKTL